MNKHEKDIINSGLVLLDASRAEDINSLISKDDWQEYALRMKVTIEAFTRITSKILND